MKALKIFLITSFVLLLVAAGAVGFVWTKFQAVTQEVSNETTFIPSEETPVANIVPEEGIKIDTSDITNEQKALAQKLGINLDEVTITPEMISCAEQKLGSARIEEISAGESPTTLESISLLGCL